MLGFERKEKRRIHNQLLFCYLNSSPSTEVYCWKEARAKWTGERRGKEKRQRNNPKKACIFPVPHLSIYWPLFLPGGIALSRKSQKGFAQLGREDSGRTPGGVASQPFLQQEGSMQG